MWFKQNDMAMATNLVGGGGYIVWRKKRQCHNLDQTYKKGAKDEEFVHGRFVLHMYMGHNH